MEQNTNNTQEIKNPTSRFIKIVKIIQIIAICLFPIFSWGAIDPSGLGDAPLFSLLGIIFLSSIFVIYDIFKNKRHEFTFSIFISIIALAASIYYLFSIIFNFKI
jgi:hypothetical protein